MTTTAYYAMGAGLGHLTRALKVISVLKLPRETLLLSNSHLLADDAQYRGEFAAIHPHVALSAAAGKTRQQMQCWLDALIVERNIKRLVVDSFPVGIKGELNGLQERFPELELIYIARILNWSAYSPLIESPPVFESCYAIEALPQEQLNFIKRCTSNITALRLQPLSQEGPIAHPLPLRYCAVVHTGSEDELVGLLYYAYSRLEAANKKFPIIAITPKNPQCQGQYPGVHFITTYPANAILAHADVVVSAGGCNSVHDIAALQCEHWLVPYARRFDDQFLRAALYRNGALFLQNGLRL